MSLEESRRSRQETSIRLRKNKKEEGLAKRRNLSEAQAAAEAAAQASSGDIIPNDVSSIPIFMQKMRNGTPEEQVEGLRGFRRLLSVEQSPPVQDCIDVGAIPFFVRALECGDRVDLQFEAAWALTNIASTDRTSVVVEAGAVPHLSRALLSGCPNVREQAAWCLGNISGDGAAYRDIILGAGGLHPLLQNIMNPANDSLLKNCTWALSNLCRGKPQPACEVVAPALPVLAELVKSPDNEVVIDATWALSYLSDGSDERIAMVVNSGVVPTLVDILRQGKTTMITPALRTLGNIVSGADEQTQAVVDAGALALLVPLLSHAKKNIRKETCWMLSNIAAGNASQLNELVRTSDLIAPLLSQLAPSAEWDVRKEAAWVVSNICTGGTSAHVLKLVEHGAIRPLCDLLEVGEVRILVVALDALEAVLRSAGASAPAFIQFIDEAHGVERIENLQEHESGDVYERCVKLIDTYFGGEDADDDDAENLAPETSADGNFTFGITAGGMADAAPSVFKFGDAPPSVNIGGSSGFGFGGETMSNNQIISGFPQPQFQF